MAGTAPRSGAIDVELTVVGDIPPQEAEAARLAVASLERYAGRPVEAARLTLRRGGGGFPDREYVADASVLFRGRLLAAHAAGPNPLEAAEAAADRLQRQLRRVVDADVAQRNEPAVIQKALADLEHDERHRPAPLKPPEHRRIIRRRTYADRPEATLEAIADLLDVDLEFLLFRHVRTEEDVVVYRRDDERVALLFPTGSILADEGDIVVPQPSWYSAPKTLDDVRAEMDVVNHRFVYFIDAADGRGKVLYMRHDGDYGLVEPDGLIESEIPAPEEFVPE
jgi:hypothetical protein